MFFADYSQNQAYQQQPPPTAAVGTPATSATSQALPTTYPGYQQNAYQMPAVSAVSSASYPGTTGYGQTAYPSYAAPSSDMSSYMSSQSAYSTTTTTTQVSIVVAFEHMSCDLHVHFSESVIIEVGTLGRAVIVTLTTPLSTGCREHQPHGHSCHLLCHQLPRLRLCIVRPVSISGRGCPCIRPASPVDCSAGGCRCGCHHCAVCDASVQSTRSSCCSVPRQPVPPSTPVA